MTCPTYAPARLEEARLISRFGMRRGRRTGEQRLHAGIDIGGPRGSTIYAPRAGIVTLVGHDSDGRRGGLYGYGNAVVLHHIHEDRYSFYAHLERALVEPGQVVAAGTPIGRLGASTNGKFPGMGAHLHMEVRHPTPDGRAPFPGPYGRYNEDPAAWLASHGVRFGHLGRFETEGAACGPPGALELGPGVQMASLPLELAPPSFTEDPNAAYEPVSADADLFAPPSPWEAAIAAVPLALVGLGLVWASR